MSCAYVDTPIGLVEITDDGSKISAIRFVDSKKSEPLSKRSEECAKAIDAYFKGKKGIPSDLLGSGTPFQQAVWKATQNIPVGETRTYGEIAKTIGKPEAVRAVGTALKNNPLLVAVPCHRVLPAGKKSLGGFAAGVERKKWLLEHEAGR